MGSVLVVLLLIPNKLRVALGRVGFVLFVLLLVEYIT